MKTKPKTKLRQVFGSNRRVDALYKNISGYINSARQNVLYSVNTEQVKTYWRIGRDIVEEEQHGKDRAEYGTFLLREISSRLTKEFGNGFGIDTVEQARKFYLVYKISDAARRKSELPTFKPNLSWTHYRYLMRIDNSNARAFYEQEASINNWATRQLERQVHSLLFERLAKSRDKKGVMRLACKGQEFIRPEDAIKDPMVLEFLNLPESHQLVESKLEDALISNMQNFLLELGRGFAFVARQKRLTLDDKHFYCDLVFYSVPLKSYLLLEILCCAQHNKSYVA